MWELWVKVYSGPNEDYSLWVSFSDSSEELLWRGKRGCQYIHDFGKGKYMPPSTYFFQKIAAGHEEQMSPLMILVFLRYETMQEIWLKKISWKYLTIWRPVLAVFPEHRAPCSCSPPWTPFRGCGRSAAAAAHNLILAEIEGKCQWQCQSEGDSS